MIFLKERGEAPKDRANAETSEAEGQILFALHRLASLPPCVSGSILGDRMK